MAKPVITAPSIRGPHVSHLPNIQIYGRVIGTDKIAQLATDEDGVVLIRGSTEETNEFQLIRRELETLNVSLVRLIETLEARVGVV